MRQLEAQLGVELLHRRGRRVTLTEAGEQLAASGAALLEHADAVVSELRGRAAAATGRVRLGVSPTARHGVLPALLEACAERAPGVMLYTAEDTTGALLRAIVHGDLDAAVTFCTPSGAREGLAVHPLAAESAVVHLRDDHPLAARDEVTLAELAGETVLIAGGRDSGGFTDRVLGSFAAEGLKPTTRADPYPDLGLQAVREGLGVVVYVRGAFPETLPGSSFISITPHLELPFDLVTRRGRLAPTVGAVVAAARLLAYP